MAEAALERRRFVSAIDVLVGLGWLAPAHLDLWRQGRIDCLERTMSVNLDKPSTAMRYFRLWAHRRGLTASETAYVARTRDRAQPRFSVSGDPGIERAYRTHWISPELCMRCAGMDQLVFLPAGDAALTRRAREASRLSAIVVRFSRSRRRYERRGILVEEAALEHART